MSEDPQRHTFRDMAASLADADLGPISARILGKLVEREEARERTGMTLAQEVAWKDQLTGWAGLCAHCGLYVTADMAEEETPGKPRAFFDAAQNPLCSDGEHHRLEES